jgi:flagellar P-ring protein precursor FlgI
LRSFVRRSIAPHLVVASGRISASAVALAAASSLFCATTLGTPRSASAARIEDLCDVGGVRPNQLIGYGLVVGLNNTGDRGQARFTLQSTAAMLRRLGATIDPAAIQTRNAAAVMVTATLPANASPGMRLDVNVASLGNARSLFGGVLLQTPLYGADRRVYAVAQGPVLVGGFAAAGATGSSVQQNHVTAGRVPEGALVERSVETPRLGANGEVFLQLRDPSFTTAQRIVEAVNAAVGSSVARAVDHGLVRVELPEESRQDVVSFVARLQLLEVEPDAPARVVVDERTGTVALGANVRIGEVAVAQGGLTVEISERLAVSQPGPLAGAGRTAVVPQSDVTATAQPGSLTRIAPTATLQDVVTALNALGARPRDLVPIIQALHRAGALRARIEVQ